MNKPPLTISVIIPAYNGARFIGEAIRSVWAQTRLPSEIIVVDDCSADDTVAVVEWMIPDSPVPLRLIRLEKNSGGPARPINRGIDAAQGEFIAVLDQDDLFSNETLEERLALLQKNSDLSLVFSWCGFLNPYGASVQTDEIKNALLQVGHLQDGSVIIPGDIAIQLLLCSGQYTIGYPGFMFRKVDWIRKGGVDEKLYIASDFDFVGWLSRLGNIGLIPKIGYWRRTHESNACKRSVVTNLECCIVRTRLFLDNPVLLQDRDLVQLVSRDFAGLAFWFREGGFYLQSARIQFLLSRLIGLRFSICSALAKLLLKCCYRTIFRIQSAPNPYTSPMKNAVGKTEDA